MTFDIFHARGTSLREITLSERLKLRTQVSHSYDFRKNGNAADTQIFGFSVAEPDHIWAVGHRAVLLVRAVDAPFGFFLEIDWQPFLAPPYRSAQSVLIQVGNHKLSPYLLTQRETAAFYCQPLEDAGANALITFEFPNAEPANNLLDTRETRELAVAFRRVRILKLLEKVPLRIDNNSSRTIWGERDRKVSIISPGCGGPDLAELFRRFEVLSGNCDLGLVMRALGHEQLSFLRFAGATPEVAMRGLETGFIGVGEQLSTEVADNPIREWMVRDAFGLRFHTHQSSDVMDEDAVLRRQSLHIKFLRRKFLEDLELGEKIFVYSDHIRPRSFEAALALFLSLNRRQSRRMLWVCPNLGDVAPGRVDEIVPGFARGSLDQFGGPMEAGHIALSGWLNVLFNAAVVFDHSAVRTGQPL